MENYNNNMMEIIHPKLYKKAVAKRLEELRKSIKAENISYGEIAELQSLAKYIDKDDTELLQWAGVKENKCLHEESISYIDLVQVDGEPYYIVQCDMCREYGTIELEEGKNTFGMSRAEIEDFKSGQAI